MGMTPMSEGRLRGMADLRASENFEATPSRSYSAERLLAHSLERKHRNEPLTPQHHAALSTHYAALAQQFASPQHGIGEHYDDLHKYHSRLSGSTA